MSNTPLAPNEVTELVSDIVEAVITPVEGVSDPDAVSEGFTNVCEKESWTLYEIKRQMANLEDVFVNLTVR